MAHIDRNDKMISKTATPSWNVLKQVRFDSVINRYVPMKKWRERSKNKHLSSRGFQKDYI